MNDIEQRIRERAYRIWEEEGRPNGRAQEHWDRARFLVGIEDNPDAAKLPNPIIEDREKGFNTPPPPTPVEPIEALENQGEFPDRFADQGEKSAGPIRRHREPEGESAAAAEVSGRGDDSRPTMQTQSSTQTTQIHESGGTPAPGKRVGSRLSFLAPWRNN